MAIVTIERLPVLCNHELKRDENGIIDTGYCDGCAALPRNYSTSAWEESPDVVSIRKAVFNALDRLEEVTGISSRFTGREVLVKPNLVTVYHDMGLKRRSYPETTDPRVLDATVLWLQRYAFTVNIVESSGRGVPTRGSFRVSGIDHLARHRGCGLIALDEIPVDRYILPRATVHREILVPVAFSRVVRGQAAYVSVPKLKTNLYTGVTLGFKNAMGVIPYNLRQRSHHYAIDRKLVEMLYLFQPDLILIDGVVGGEGECPAPVDPVDSRMIIAGDHPVETDRVAAGCMGFDPSSIKLIREADNLGFGDPDNVKVLTNGFGPEETEKGYPVPASFREADWMLTSERVREAFPDILVLIGIDRGGLTAKNGRELVKEMQESCRGGCVATTRFAFSMFYAEGVKPRRPAALIIGPGVEHEGSLCWYDADGKSYSEADIRSLPMKKAAIGSCTRGIAQCADRFIEGCMVLPNAPHMVLHELTRTGCRVMSLHNRNFLPLLADILGQRSARRRIIKEGRRLDVSLRLDDLPVETRDLTKEEADRDWVEWPMTPVDKRERKELLAFEDDAIVASFRGILLPRVKDRFLWRAQGALAAGVTLFPATVSLLSVLFSKPLLGLSAVAWLGIFAAIEVLHALELRAALKAWKNYSRRRVQSWTGKRRVKAVLATLVCGYTCWVPKNHGVFG